MKEAEVIQITQYAYAVLGRSLPKGCIMKVSEDEVVTFHKYFDDYYSGKIIRHCPLKPAGFYFSHNETFVLRSKYDGHALIEFSKEEINHILSFL